MFSFQLSAEQQEFRDTVRDFVTREVKPVANHPDRLQAQDTHFVPAILEQASQMGLRTLALSEAAGGAGADNLTACVVTEELAAGDIGFAATLARTSELGHVLFDQAMSEAQRKQFLAKYLEDDNFQGSHSRARAPARGRPDRTHRAMARRSSRRRRCECGAYRVGARKNPWPLRSRPVV